MRLAAVFILLVLLPLVTAVPMSFSDQGTGLTLSGVEVGSGDLGITIWSAATGGTLLYNETFNGAIVNGSWNVIMNDSLLELEFGVQYWKDYTINGTDLDFDGDERISLYSSLGLINNQSFVNGSNVGGWSTNGSVTSTMQNLGIGTTAPLREFHINGSNPTWYFERDGFFQLRLTSTSGEPEFSTIDTGSSSGNLLFQASETGGVGIGADFQTIDTKFYIQSEGNSTNYTMFAENADGDDLFVIQDDGRIGIGTSSPARKLEIAGNATDVAALRITQTDTITNEWDFGNMAGNHHLILEPSTDASFFIRNSSNGIIAAFETDDDIYFIPPGNVGIGTSTPEVLLDIGGGATDANSEATTVSVSHATQPDVSFVSTNLSSTNNAARIFAGYDAGSFTSGFLRFQTHHTNQYLNTSMTIKAGNVGIGTLDPAVKLDIGGASSNSNATTVSLTHATEPDISFVVSDLSQGADTARIVAGTDGGTFDQSWLKFQTHHSTSADLSTTMTLQTGNVGIGTSTPSVKLEVVGNTSTLLFLNASGPAASIDANAILLGKGPIGAGRIFLRGENTNKLFSQTGITNLPQEIDILSGTTEGNGIRIAANGNIGLGTTAPSAKLHINSSDLSLLIQNTSGSDHLVVNATSGYVGIGTNSPVSALEVAGNVRARDIVTASGYVFRSAGGAYLRAAGTNNINVGDSGVQNILLANGGGNVGIGTTNPSETLHVNGTVRFENETGTLGLYQHENGAVGIGIAPTSTALKLRVYEPTLPAQVMFQTASSSQYASLQLSTGDQSWRLQSSSNEQFYIEDITAGTLPFHIGDGAPSDSFYMTGSGNIGLGKTPQFKLDVNGSINATSLNVTEDVCLSDGTCLSSNGNITGSGATNSIAYYDDVDSIASRADFVFDPANGRLSLNTTTASSTLNIGGSRNILFVGSGTTFIDTQSEQPLYIRAGGTAENATLQLRGNQIRFLGYDPSGNSGSVGITSKTTANVPLVIGGQDGQTADLLVFANGSNDALSVVDATGQLGIGIADPVGPLHVNGATSSEIHITTDLTGNTGGDDGLLLQVDSNNYTYIWNREESRMYFGTNDTTRITILEDGNVGIGTTSPDGDLVVHDAADSRIYLTTDESGSGGGDGLLIELDANNNTFIWNREDADMFIGTNDTTQLTIDNAGNVGIGGSPISNKKLYVAGDVQASEVFATTLDVSSTNSRFRNDSELNFGTDRNFSLVYTTSSDTLDVLYDTTRIMSFDPSGNVGIGTIVPNHLLDVDGHINASTINASEICITGGNCLSTVSGTSLWLNTSGNATYVGGNVGIGTTTPTRMLTIEGGDIQLDNDAKIYFKRNTSTADPRIEYDENNDFRIINTQDREIAFLIDNTKAMHINSAGLIMAGNKRISANANNVHFNITTGAGMWFKASQAVSSGNISFIQSSTEVVRITSDYLVGINDTTPDATFDVAGSIQFDDFVSCTALETDGSGNLVCGTDEGGAGTTNSTSWNRTGTDVLLANTDDSVGIGTNAPTQELDVNGSVNISSKLYVNGGGPASTPDIASATDTNTGMYWSGADSLRFATAGSQRMEITAGGYLIFGAGGQLAPSDSISTPSFTFVGDTNTGMYNPADDEIGLVGGSNEVLRVNGTSENVGIGETSPARKLHVSEAMRIEPQSGAPSSAALGDLYIDSDTDELCFFNSTAWVGLQGRTCA
ncbi:MAG: hypothetical protein OXR66_08260 [Candidatus Woesearchaeota archaeon]|nr:hypothetical protein [Candidatus Woesearchaeota archaeon]